MSQSLQLEGGFNREVVTNARHNRNPKPLPQPIAQTPSTSTSFAKRDLGFVIQRAKQQRTQSEGVGTVLWRSFCGWLANVSLKKGEIATHPAPPYANSLKY